MKIAILYATQTGKSCEVAKIIKNAIELGYNRRTFYNFNGLKSKHEISLLDIGCTKIISSEGKIKIFYYDFLEEMQSNSSDSFRSPGKLHCIDFIIFVVSTHGDGTHAYSLLNFWEDFVPIPNFAVFGLGDSSYEKFNYSSKKLFNRLSLSGKGFRRGEGDEQDPCGVYTGLRMWLKDLCTYIEDLHSFLYSNKLSLNVYKQSIQMYSGSHDSKKSDKFDSINQIELESTLCLSKKEILKKKIFQKAKVVEKKILTQQNYQSPVLEVSFEIENPCQTLGIVPANYNVKDFSEFMEIKSNWLDWINFNQEPGQLFFLHLHEFISLESHKKTTNKYVDDEMNYLSESSVTSSDLSNNEKLIPNLSLSTNQKNSVNKSNHYERSDSIYILNSFISQDIILKRLLEIGHDYDIYYNYIVKAKRSVYQVLKELNIKVSLDFLVENLTINFSRYYTVMKFGNIYKIAALINNKGLCSKYLLDIKEGDFMFVRTYTKEFGLRRNTCFVCTGTGITVPLSILSSHLPFSYINFTRLSIAKDRLCGYKNELPSDPIPIVVYGFRYKEKDFLYRKLLETLHQNSMIKLYTAVSRENKEYVQDIVSRIDVSNYDVFVSGNVRLIKEIRKVLPGKKFLSETW